MFDEEIEKVVLFYIIFEHEELDITEDDFVDKRNKAIANAINELKDKKVEISMITIQDIVGKNKSEVLLYLSKLGDYVYGTGPDIAYKKLIELSKKRKLYKMAQEIIQDVEKTDDVDIYLQEKVKEIDKISEKKQEEKTFTRKIEETVEEIEKNCKNSSDYSYYTGIFDLDDLTCGLHRQELTIIGARPSMGKTTLALQIGKKIATNGKNVLFVSLEMSENQLIQKMIAQQGNIQGYRMRMGILEDKDWEKVMTSANELSKLNFNITSKIKTIQQLEAEARRLKNKNKLDLLIIDYIQLMKSEGKYSVREQEVADISRRLKLMSLDLDIPIIALCQLNRNASNNEPDMRDLRESGSLEQDADNIIFLYKEDPDKELTTLKLAKQRAGETGKVRVAFRKNISSFVNIEWKGAW